MTSTTSSILDENRQPSPIISFIQSQKEEPLLILDKHIFKVNKSTVTKKCWICTFTGCPVKIHTNINDEFIKIIDDHSHLAEEEKISIRVFHEKIKQRAIEKTTPIPRIYDEECAKALLPSEREMNSSVNRARCGVTPTIPTTQLFDIPNPYASTLRQNNFLTVDKMITRRQRITLFESVEQLKLLFTAETILMGGTFSACPNIFDQVYTIHSIKYDQSFPCVFGLLPNRHKITYQSMVHELKSIAKEMKFDFTPKMVMSNFEPALATVVKIEFSTSTHTSCYFHFTQAVYRAIQPVGLFSTYNNDNDVKHFCRKLMALPLLPEPIIEDTYDGLVGNLSTTMRKTIDDLLVYFEGQWFVKVPTTQWCVYGLSMRTNNNAEAFQSRFNRRVQIYQANIWSFIKFLQGEENRFHYIYTQFDAGLDPRTKQKNPLLFNIE